MILSLFRRRAEPSADAAMIDALTAALNEAHCQADAKDAEIAMLRRSLADTHGNLLVRVMRMDDRRAAAPARDASGRFV